MPDNYTLNGKRAVLASDLNSWAQWYGKADRRVARTQVGESDISTVFLGLDHSFGVGPPELFETMIFGGPYADFCQRYETWEDAEASHEHIVARLKDGLAPIEDF